MLFRSELQAEFESLQTKTGLDILAQPRIMAANHKPASIITGERLGYKVQTINGSSISESIEFLEVGTKLNFTPPITNKGHILMKIHPVVSEGSIVDDLPKENTTETTTEVMVKDGQTIIIGGLIRQKDVITNAGIPILVDLPFVGFLFGKQTTTTQKRELIVLITPHILTTAEVNSGAANL